MVVAEAAVDLSNVHPVKVPLPVVTCPHLRKVVVSTVLLDWKMNVSMSVKVQLLIFTVTLVTTSNCPFDAVVEGETQVKEIPVQLTMVPVVLISILLNVE